MHLFFSAGEASGDQHAAHLIRQLQTRQSPLRCSGLGGPEMEAAGLECLYPLTNLAVMGFSGVVPLLRTFWQVYRQAQEFFAQEKPDAVILVDFPGFNWWIAKAARREGIPVYYYCPPQMWAWAGWRIRKMRRLVDCVLSVLPFEAKWYRERGMDVEYVGHPFFDEVAAHPLDADTMRELNFPGRMVLGLLPGSRRQEVNRNFPLMLEIAAAIHARHPGVRFPVACYKEWHRDRCAQLLAESGRSLPVELLVGRTSEVIEAADSCLMVSGSVSLEMLARHTPAVVLYRAGAFSWCLGHLLRTIDYISLPNLIADRAVMPEFPFLRARGRHMRRMVEILDHWLSDPASLSAARQELTRLADEVVQRGGVARAAEVLLERVKGGQIQPAAGNDRAAA